MNFWTTMYI